MPDNNDYEMDPPKTAGGPWGSGGGSGGNGNGDGGSPWNRPSGGGGGGQGGGGGPDLEEQMKRMQERFRSRRRGGGGKGGSGGIGKGGFALLLLAGLVAWLFTGVVTVNETERAVIFRLGQYKDVYGPGFHLHWPQPFETHEKIPSQVQNQTEIGRTPSESLMLTKDGSIVDVRFKVFWRYEADKPQAFILNVENGDELVKAAVESVMREVVGQREFDEIITTDRQTIQEDVQAKTQELLNSYRAGAEIRRIQIQEAKFPQAVRAAFTEVITANQEANRVIEEANKFQNDIIPRAQGEATRLREVANGYREEVVSTATGESERFLSILAEYRKAPQVTRERMYLETIERILAKSDKLILDSEAGAVPYLPLDPVARRNEGGQ